MDIKQILTEIKNGKRKFAPASYSESDIETFQSDAKVLEYADQEGWLDSFLPHSSIRTGKSYYDLILVQKGLSYEGELHLQSMATDDNSNTEDAKSESYKQNNTSKNMEASPLLNKKFKVALSFPGEKRDFVYKVALGLQKQIGDVFYDKFFEAELALPDQDIILQKIYHENSDLVVVFICEEYEKKEWCGLEWRAIRDLIKQRKSNFIMLMRFDDTKIDGLFSIDGFINLQDRTPEETVNLICKRIKNSI